MLHVAAQLGYDRCIELILYYCPDINAQTEGGSTPLHYACSQGHATCVKLLLDAGAKVHLCDIMDQTAKDVAQLSAKNDWDTCVQLIDEEEVRFGMKVIKVAGGAALGVSIVAALAWWFRRRSRTNSS